MMNQSKRKHQNSRQHTKNVLVHGKLHEMDFLVKQLLWHMTNLVLETTTNVIRAIENADAQTKPFAEDNLIPRVRELIMELGRHMYIQGIDVGQTAGSEIDVEQVLLIGPSYSKSEMAQMIEKYINTREE